MSWNYRVVRKRGPDKDSYWLAEVSYDEEGRPCRYGHAFPFGYSLEELRVELRRLREALEQPVLDEDGLPENAYVEGVHESPELWQGYDEELAFARWPGDESDPPNITGVSHRIVPDDDEHDEIDAREHFKHPYPGP